MTETIAETNSSSDTADFVKKNYRFNFLVNMADGGFFWFGYSFITPSTILPLFAAHYTTNPIIISLIPFIFSLGFLSPQLFTANWVSRLPLKKYLPVRIGLYSERLPLLLLGPAILLLREASGSMILTAFFLLICWNAFGAGLIAVGWQDMIAKVIPTEKRGAFFGITNFTGTAAGIVGAACVGWFLGVLGFPNGYVVAFSFAGLLIFLSWISISLTREPRDNQTQPTISQSQYFKTLPVLLKKDKNFRWFITSLIFVAFSGMATGFVIVYMIQRWNIPDQLGGNLTAALLIGQSLANPILGKLADRKGNKLVYEVSILIGAVSIGLAFISHNPVWFYAVFALRGINTAGSFIAGTNLPMEFSDPNLRPTYIGLSNTMSGIAAGLSPLLGGWLALFFGYQGLFLITFIISIGALVLLHFSVKDPRFHNQSHSE